MNKRIHADGGTYEQREAETLNQAEWNDTNKHTGELRSEVAGSGTCRASP